jgi:hypothetical protein
MAKVTEVKIVCDGCKTELPDKTPGASLVHVDENGSTHTRKIELCPACTGKLPEGTKRKRPERKPKA